MRLNFRHVSTNNNRPTTIISQAAPVLWHNTYLCDVHRTPVSIQTSHIASQLDFCHKSYYNNACIKYHLNGYITSSLRYVVYCKRIPPFWMAVTSMRIYMNIFNKCNLWCINKQNCCEICSFMFCDIGFLSMQLQHEFFQISWPWKGIRQLR